MKHEIIKRVIADMHRVIHETEITDRNYVFEKNANYILTGLRRSGKSTLLYKIAKDLVTGGELNGTRYAISILKMTGFLVLP